MTGGDEETEIKQYAKLYKRMPATKKDQLFHLTGCKRKVVVNRKTGLAMKSLCGLKNAVQIAEENTAKIRNNLCK